MADETIIPDALPYSIIQRADGLWTAVDATGREVDGIASRYRENAENFVRAMGVWRDNPPGGPGTYIHLTHRDE